jgi:predicted glycosyltransferase
MARNIRRILVYTHNSIGLGHVFRTLAVITGMRKSRPDIDFLVLSSSSVPQIFFQEGIEVVKLPSVKLNIDAQDNRLEPRYLGDCDLESIFEFRQRIILETFDFFQPDALLIEHNMTGQMSELIPLLMKKWMRKGGPADFALAHICRGIMRWVPLLTIPYENPRHRSESINIGLLYDFMYVLEDREVIDINKAFLGDDPDLEKKIRYLGKITRKVREELSAGAEVAARFGLTDSNVILASLGRGGRVLDLSVRLLEIFRETGADREHQIVMVLDPYLARDVAEAIVNHPLSGEVRFLHFVPDLVDLINHSRLVISRAGYNTVNEILLTGAKAVLIPESHGGGEQELRVRSVPAENMLVFAEDELFGPQAAHAMIELLNSPSSRDSISFDKYAIGQAILEELETWRAEHRRRPLGSVRQG